MRCSIGVISLALIDCRTSTTVCRCASYNSKHQKSANPCPPMHCLIGARHLPPPLSRSYLHHVAAVVHRHLEAPPQSALRVAAAEQLPDLARELAHLGLADLGQRRVQRRRVEVEARVLLQGVDVDRAPCVAERGRRVLLDDGHCRSLCAGVLAVLQLIGGCYLSQRAVWES